MRLQGKCALNLACILMKIFKDFHSPLKPSAVLVIKALLMMYFQQ